MDMKHFVFLFYVSFFSLEAMKIGEKITPQDEKPVFSGEDILSNGVHYQNTDEVSYYVSENGNDNNFPCNSQENPCETMKALQLETEKKHNVFICSNIFQKEKLLMNKVSISSLTDDVDEFPSMVISSEFNNEKDHAFNCENSFSLSYLNVKFQQLATTNLSSIFLFSTEDNAKIMDCCFLSSESSSESPTAVSQLNCNLFHIKKGEATFERMMISDLYFVGSPTSIIHTTILERFTVKHSVIRNINLTNGSVFCLRPEDSSSTVTMTLENITAKDIAGGETYPALISGEGKGFQVVIKNSLVLRCFSTKLIGSCILLTNIPISINGSLFFGDRYNKQWSETDDFNELKRHLFDDEFINYSNTQKFNGQIAVNNVNRSHLLESHDSRNTEKSDELHSESSKQQSQRASNEYSSLHSLHRQPRAYATQTPLSLSADLPSSDSFHPLSSFPSLVSQQSFNEDQEEVDACTWASSFIHIEKVDKLTQTSSFNHTAFSHHSNGVFCITEAAANMAYVVFNENSKANSRFPSARRNLICFEGGTVSLQNIVGDKSSGETNSLWMLRDGQCTITTNEAPRDSYFYIPRLTSLAYTRSSDAEQTPEDRQISITFTGEYLLPCNTTFTIRRTDGKTKKETTSNHTVCVFHNETVMYGEASWSELSAPASMNVSIECFLTYGTGFNEYRTTHALTLRGYLKPFNTVTFAIVFVISFLFVGAVVALVVVYMCCLRKGGRCAPKHLLTLDSNLALYAPIRDDVSSEAMKLSVSASNYSTESSNELSQQSGHSPGISHFESSVLNSDSSLSKDQVNEDIDEDDFLIDPEALEKLTPEQLQGPNAKELIMRLQRQLAMKSKQLNQLKDNNISTVASTDPLKSLANVAGNVPMDYQSPNLED